jgi:ribosomal small subunit protein bTHX
MTTKKTIMGKGDVKSKRGKINRGTSGVRRQKKKVTAQAVATEKPVVKPKKKAAAKKTTTKKAATKKAVTKKTTTKKKAED